MKTINIITSLILLLCLSSILTAQKIEEVFSLKWETEIGVTTFRTNILYHEKTNSVLIGSNGKSRNKLNDPKDGVYIINPLDGKIKQHINIVQAADGDVNGVGIANNSIYFGDDNDRIYCYTLDGKEKWKTFIESPNGGDIEGCVTFIKSNADDILDVVLMSENQGLLVIDGNNGEVIWEKSYNFYGYGLNSPTVYDLNSDGVDDVIIGSRSNETYQEPGDYWPSYGDWIFAFDGKTGKELWKYPTQSALNASPMILVKNKEPYIVHAATYSNLIILDKNGKKVTSKSTGVPRGGISGFFSSPVITPNDQFILGTAWWGKDDGVWVFDLDEEEGELTLSTHKFHKIGRTSGSAVVADIVKKSKGYESVICSENGTMLILNENGEELYQLKLPSGAEATPHISDIDGDKKLEILVACLDGKLYCYKTGLKGKVFIGQFRINNQNTGVKAVK